MPLSIAVSHCRGDAGKYNWLLVRLVPEASRCVVFFPGDISDFASGGAPYGYSLEALMWVLCCKYPKDSIVLVKSRMMVGFFAIYVNFMLVDGQGNPRPRSDLHVNPDVEDNAGRLDDVVSGPSAVDHLEALLSTLGQGLQQALPRRLVLVGFSKGTAVLSALLKEPAKAFWNRVEDVHFVDPGLTIPGIFPVYAEELHQLAFAAGAGFRIWLHCTPRQIEDPDRPYIAEECNVFAQNCEAAGLQVERRVYGRGLPPSLDMHFDAIKCFQTSVDDKEAGDRHCGFFRSWAIAAAEGD